MVHDPSRTEEATPKRRDKARKEGNVPKSQELPKPLTLLVGVLALHFFLSGIAQEFRTLMFWFFQESFGFEANPATLYHLFQKCLWSLARMTLPVMLLIAVAAFAVVRLQVGKLWAPKVLKPTFKNLNVFAGLKKLFLSKDSAVRLVKSILMALAVSIGPYFVLRDAFTEVLPLFYQTPANIALYILETGQRMFWYALAPMLLIGIADFLYTRWDYANNLKMTKSEVKDEHKQAEGDPVVKSKQRQKMMEAMQKRMLQDVPKADVIITNPTHLALAIRYNALEAPAPMILAKGAGPVAERIKEAGREHGVPLRENKPLARALYKVVEVGETIPEEFYQAVAAVLAQVYKARQSHR